MAGAVALFSAMDALLKLLVERYPPMQVTTLRGLASLPFLLLPFLLRLREPARGESVDAATAQAAAGRGRTSFLEARRVLFRIRTLRRLWFGLPVVGIALEHAAELHDGIGGAVLRPGQQAEQVVDLWAVRQQGGGAARLLERAIRVVGVEQRERAVELRDAERRVDLE